MEHVSVKFKIKKLKRQTFIFIYLFFLIVYRQFFSVKWLKSKKWQTFDNSYF